MNILAAGDLHLRKSAPAMRIDDYPAVQWLKLQEILDIAKTNSCRVVIFPGDVFDRPDAPYALVEQAIRLLRSYDLFYLFVFGQHDLRYHTSDKVNTPLGVLSTALSNQAFILSPEKPFRLSDGLLSPVFWGCSWGEPLPENLDPTECNVVVMHRPITVEKLPWEHEAMMTAAELVKACPAKLFITGDNHAQFCVDFRRASVLNLGSVMRSTIAQIDHKPAVALISFERKKPAYKLMSLTIRKNVFDMQTVQTKKESEERLAAFVDGLRGEFDPELKFIDNLRLAAQDIPVGVKAIIDEIMS